ncbi:MAG: tetratricopeptide repeat protein [Flavobacteriales bacterium]|nr:tetratricopeptide repeat protein [Flavobacteriales bacterium]MCB9167515.1 tetratricopeptide repeat protein [Flavobacteriales bacterium]
MTTTARIDREVTDFERQVIARSADVPVLVDLWAAWCGPCRFLGPIVEKLADEADGRWELVKVDVEANPALAERFQVRGIPALKLFHKGAVIAELAGALPEAQLLAWIEAHLPTPGGERLAEARSLLEAGREKEATTLLEGIVREMPEVEEARVLLARAIVFDDPGRVRELLAHHGHLDGAETLLVLSDALMREVATLPEGAARASMAEALEALHQHDMDSALERLIEVVLRDKPYADELARRLCVALFEHLGPAHPLTRSHRRRFDMALY